MKTVLQRKLLRLISFVCVFIDFFFYTVRHILGLSERFNRVICIDFYFFHKLTLDVNKYMLWFNKGYFTEYALF